MTNEDRELLATVIMGWHKKASDWCPDEDIEQALQLVDALRSKEYDCVIDLLAKAHGEQCYCRVSSCIIGHAPVQGEWGMSSKTLPRAIAAAALKVAKAMKEEEHVD